MLNISPQIYPKKLWVGGASKILAFPIILKKQIFLGINWILKFIKNNLSILT